MRIKCKFDSNVILPTIILPEGYMIRAANINEDGFLTESDLKAWIDLHRNGYTVSGEELSEFFHDFYEKKKKNNFKVRGEGIFLVEHNGVAVGGIKAIFGPCEGFSVKLLLNNEGSLGHAVVSEEHRRKGLYKAMCIKGLEYLRDRNVEYVYLTPLEMLNNFWKRIFKEFNEVSKHDDE